MRVKRRKSIRSLLAMLLAVAMLTGMVPAGAQTVTAEAPVAAGMDSYTQSLSGTNSFVPSGSGSAATVDVNGEAIWGLSGKALQITTAGDYRIKLTDVGDLADGIYEISLRTGNSVPNSIGFLARYKDEQNYAGLSLDSNGKSWVAHYSQEGSGRVNETVAAAPVLTANTSYKVSITYAGDELSFGVTTDDDTYTQIGTHTMTGTRYTGAGGFAIRVHTGTVTVDNIVQKTLDGTVVATMDFDAATGAPAYECRSNRGTTVDNTKATLTPIDIPSPVAVEGFAEGKASYLDAEGAALFIDNASPAATHGVLSAKVNATTNQLGLVLRYQDENNYAAVWYDGTKWVAGGKAGGSETAHDLSALGIPAPVAGTTHTIGINYQDDANTVLSLDGVDYALNALGLFAGEGKVGLMVGEGATVYAEPIALTYQLQVVTRPDPTGNFIAITSDTMKVLVGDSFPHIYTYKDAATGTSMAYGTTQAGQSTDMVINRIVGRDGYTSYRTEDAGVLCTTTSVLTASTADSATYAVTATGDGIEAVFTVVLSVSGNQLHMEIPAVEQKTGVVRTFAFVDHSMVSLAGIGAGAALGVTKGWGPASDVMVDLKNLSADTAYADMTYALMYDRASGYVAAIENNAENGKDKYAVKAVVEDDTYVSFTNNYWAWQFYESSEPENDVKPYADVVIGGDESGDGNITWQDAGIAYRQIMRKPYGYENVKNEWMFIAMNMSSQASQPFVRVLDAGKAISYLTDGFGQKIMNKGYQAGGHDDSHGDYDFVGVQQGGVKDFNYLINEGLKYGIKNGIHLNATEFALDGFETEMENMLNSRYNGIVQNWNWFDQAYKVDKTLDIVNGDLERRLGDLKSAAPNLDFIYVDVYQSHSLYNATQFMKYMNANGWTVGTEALGDFNQDVAFVHWNTDLYYAVGGTQSEVLRFVTHGTADVSAPDKALLGALMPGEADWRNTNIFSDAQALFYRNNLPTKYLQHFDLLDWTPDQSATLSGNVRTEVQTVNGTPYLSILKDERLLAYIDVSGIKAYDEVTGNPGKPGSAEIFIPWSPEAEDKIYCYNDVNRAKTWDVPKSWGQSGTAYLYRLTNSGRTELTEVSYAGGKIALTLDLSTPYVLTRDQAGQPHLYTADGVPAQAIPAPTGEHAWGEGSAIADFGFTSGTLNAWTVTGGTGASVDLTFAGTNNGAVNKGTPGADPRVKLDNGFTGSISQTVTVEPGKTYSFSAWTMSEGARPVTLSVTAGGKTVESSVDTTAGAPVKIKPSKYTGVNYQRVKVDVTIPEGVTSAVLRFSTVAGEQPVYVDDFRCWQWTGTPNPLTQEYYYYEDFENLDENWGPFVSQVGTQPYIHLAYKNPEGGQIKYYTVDTLNAQGQPDMDNLTSLKFQQFGAGILARSLPSTLKLEAGKTYEITMDYQSYHEIRASQSAGLVDVTVEGQTFSPKYFGYNYPQSVAMYYVDVRYPGIDSADVQSYAFNPSTFAEQNVDEFSYNSRPSTETMTFTVEANRDDLYLTIRENGAPLTSILAIDNFRVKEVGVLPLQGAKAAVENAAYAMTQAGVADEEAVLAKIQAVLGGLDLSGAAATVNKISYTAPVAGDAANHSGNDGAYTFTVTLAKEGETSLTTCILSAVITATAYVPVEPPYNPGTGGSTSGSGTTEKNPDGSTTKTETDKKTGEVKQTTTYPDGTKIVVTTPKDGKAAIDVTVPAGKDRVTVTIPTGGQPAPGEVAVIIHADGTREIVKNSVPTGEGMKVTLDASCSLEIIDNSKHFADVSADHWGVDAIAFVSSRELFVGSDSGFEPEGEMSRAMLFTVLARLSGQDLTGGENWYSKAMDWAKETGVSDGTNPKDSITRESLATMLYRYAGSPQVDGMDMGEFSDTEGISSWANDAMLWCVNNGILKGDGNQLDPTGTASRVEVAAMLMRYTLLLA